MSRAGSPPPPLPSSDGGESAARNRLFEKVYAELREQASSYLRKERPDHTLQPTALVNETWLRLFEQGRIDVPERKHFLALAARAMRRILVDHARSRSRSKRGGSWQRVAFEEVGELEMTGANEFDLVSVDRALERLCGQSKRMARIVELRFFGGLSREEVAEIMDISMRTVAREWRAARALMIRLLSEESGELRAGPWP